MMTISESPTGTRTKARFKVGDRVRVVNVPYLFYSRTQMYVRGLVGTIADTTYEDLIPEDEAFNVEGGRIEQYYIIRFRQQDIWPEYPFPNDTLQTESPERWLEPADEPSTEPASK